jgi:hypothetical protein
MPSRIKRKVFISYHHERDQFWFNHFTNTFSEDYDVFEDQSLDDEVDSEDLDYVSKVIREDHIKGSSITIVLCGSETWKRRFIDWEIASTLHHEHALLGILIPRTLPATNGKYSVPDRLYKNIESGFAAWSTWPGSPGELKTLIEGAVSKSNLRFLIQNDRLKMRRNLA